MQRWRPTVLWGAFVLVGACTEAIIPGALTKSDDADASARATRDASVAATGDGSESEAPKYLSDACMGDINLWRGAPVDETTPLGFSAREVVDTFNAGAHGTLNWLSTGATTTLTLHASLVSDRARYDATPPYAGYCFPTLSIAVEVALRTEDGQLAEQSQLDLVAVADGEGGIALIFPMELRFDPSDLRGSFVLPPELKRAEDDTRALRFELTLSASAQSAYCAANDTVSDDPNASCTRYAGVLRFTSYPRSARRDEHYTDTSAFLNAALATLTLDP